MSPRPTGVSVLAILMIVGGALGILGSFFAILAAASLVGAFGALIAMVVVIPLIIAVVQLVVGVGLWKLMPWAWMAAVVVVAIGAILAIINLITGNSAGSNIVSILIDAIILWYLFRPEVMMAFGRA